MAGREHPLTRKDRNPERSDVDMGKNKSILLSVYFVSGRLVVAVGPVLIW